ncbi:MAG: PDZ domain-containing protein [Actinomycetota bacterium]
MQETVLEHPASPDSAPDRASTPSGRRIRAITALIVLAMVLGISNLHLPYDVFTPGVAPDAASFIKLGNPALAQRRAGTIHLTTVGVYYGVRLPQLVAAWLNPKDQVVSEKDYPRNTAAEVAAMDQSERWAELAAFAELGAKNLPTNGALITQLRVNAPAYRFLAPGDVIIGADGQTVTSADQLAPVVLTHQPGQSVHLTWLRSDAKANAPACPAPTTSRSADIPVIRNASPPPERIVGVSSAPNVVLPGAVCINAGDIEGPSAGLSWALAIVNLLGPTDLTRGRTIADTGTMDPAGVVGNIGGIQQKVYGAEAEHATLFLCPKGQARDALATVQASHSSMKVIGVSTLHEAVQALANP